MSTLAHRVREARLSAGITSQSGLARAINKQPQTIQSIESGATKRSKFLPDIAAATGVRLEWLIDGCGEMRTGEAPREPTTYTLDTIAEHTGDGDALLRITDVANAPEFLLGDMLTVRPLNGREPESPHVVAVGARRAALLAVTHGINGTVYTDPRTLQMSTAGDLRVIGEVAELRRRYVAE